MYTKRQAGCPDCGGLLHYAYNFETGDTMSICTDDKCGSKWNVIYEKVLTAKDLKDKGICHQYV